MKETSKFLREGADNPAEAKIIFQDAVNDVFDNNANPQDRALLRDHLAGICCPKGIVDELNSGLFQLDTTEFLSFLLDNVLPEENKLDMVSKVEFKENGVGIKKTLQTSSIETKIDIPFPTDPAKNTVDCDTMVAAYEASESFIFREDNNATKIIQPQVRNENAEVVISFKRFETELSADRKFVKRKINTKVNLNNITLSIAGKTEKKKEYRATSFIVHSGGIDGGHYLTYIQENDGKWYCYNDKDRTEVVDRTKLDGTIVSAAEELEKAKSQAYVVKYSPLDTNGECVLPPSQVHGTINGGNRCWANAAFAFALSMTSLYNKNHTRTSKSVTAKPIIHSPRTTEFDKPSEEQKTIEFFASSLIDFDNGNKLLSDLIIELKSISNHSLAPELIANINIRLEEVGYPLSKVILQNSVQRYLLELAQEQDDDKINEILGLRDFFSEETNSETTLKIIAEIKAAIGQLYAQEKSEEWNNFIADPLGFCVDIISPGSLTREAEKDKFRPKAPLQFATTQDLCYAAIIEGDKDKLKKLLPHAIKNDKDFLTNALCYAIVNEKDSITNILINDHKANPKKKSALYEKTAEEIVKELGKKLPSPKIKKLSPVKSPPAFTERTAEIVGDNIEITLTKTDKKTKKGTIEKQTINVAGNEFIELDRKDKSNIILKKEDFKKELMDYYNGEKKGGKDNLSKSALEVLHLYQAFPNSTFKPKEVIQVFTIPAKTK